MMHITGKEYALKDIFCNKFIMSIPSYQRPYAWETEQTQTMLEDFIYAMGDLEDPKDNQNAYFLGSIVIVKNDDDPKSLVVDGQQRITTITILLAVIRSLVTDDKLIRLLTKRIFMEEDEIVDEHECFFLTLRDRDARFFQDYIQRDQSLQKIKEADLSKFQNKESQRRIIENT
jgi:uncharacterized protein with ParB-like and HNH nuclease domain